MSTLKINISYRRNGSELKCIESDYDYEGVVTNYLLDIFVIESIMNVEEPDQEFIDFSAVLPDVYPGNPGTKAKNNKELAELNGLSEVLYEVNSEKRKITT